MPIGSWVVESVIRYTSNGVATMERDAAAMNSTRIRAAELRGEITAQEAAWLRLDERVAKSRAQRMAFFAESAGVGAIAGAAVLGFSIDQAANMERSMLNLQIATHASKLTMDAFRDSIYATANATAQSAPDIAAIYGSIASTSGLPAKSLTPQFMATATKFGEIVQAKSMGTAHEYTALEAATQAIELAHQYRAYSPQQLTPFLEMLHKALYFMPGGLSQFVTQSKYFAPLMAMSAGNVDAMGQSIDLGILLQQTGLGRGKGGSGVATFERAILQGLTMTRFASGGRHAALLAAGLIDRDGNTPFMRTNAQNQTYFDIIGALAQVQKYADAKTGNLTGTARSHAEERVLRTIFSALGINGSLIAAVAAGGGNLQMRNVHAREQLIPSISQDQAARLQTFWMALQRDTRGLDSLGAALGGPAITQITPNLKKFGDGLWTATQYLERHQGAAGNIFDGIAGVTGASAAAVVAALAIKAVRLVATELIEPLAVPAAYAVAGGIGLAGILGPMYPLLRHYYTSSANADPGTPGYTAWHEHLHRAMQHVRVGGSAETNIRSGLARDLIRIHEGKALLRPNVGEAALGLPTMPPPAHFTAWSKLQQAVADLATRNGAFTPATLHGLAAIGSSGVAPTLAKAASDLRATSKTLSAPKDIHVSLDISLPPGMRLDHASAIVKDALDPRSAYARSGKYTTHVRVPIVQTVQPY